MFAERLSPLINSYPDEAEGLRRMANYLQDFESRRGDTVFKIQFNPARMFDIMQAGTSAHLAVLISILLKAKIIKRILIVRCPSGEGITFASYEEIPETVTDPGKDIKVRVRTDIVEPTYLLVKDDAC